MIEQCYLGFPNTENFSIENFEKTGVQKFRVSNCNEISVPKLRKIKYSSGHENSKISKEFSLTSKIYKKM